MARKPPKRMFKNQEMASPYQLSRSPIKLMKRVSRDHEDVLENIEAVLVSAHRLDDEVDDRIADEALAGSLTNQWPEDPRAAIIFEILAKVREARSDVPDDLWRDALKVVRDSVKRHSACKPREKNYLLFASQYIG